MALIPVEERVEPPQDEVYSVEAFGGARRDLAYPVNSIVEEIRSIAEKEGFTDPNLFRIFSGYRSDASQQRLYDNKVARLMQDDPNLTLAEAQRLARKTVAPPGRSSHRSGYAFDMYFGHKHGHKIDDASLPNTKHIEGTEAYAFMRELAPLYGLTQLPNEPWHWECDKDCRDAYMRRELHTGGVGVNANAASSVSNTIGRVLIATSIVGASAFIAWRLTRKSKNLI